MITTPYMVRFPREFKYFLTNKCVLLPLDFPAASKFVGQHICSCQGPQARDQLGKALLQATEAPCPVSKSLTYNTKQRKTSNINTN